MKTYELYHHGVKGQKWGIRRYQNSDGSLTPAGRSHYGLSDIYGGDRTHIWDRDDYTINKGTVLTRQSSKILDKLIDEDRPYSYVYDDSSERDNDFYTSQFGKYKNKFETTNDMKVAGIDTIANVVKNMLYNKPVDEIDIDSDTFNWVDHTISHYTHKQLSATHSFWDPKKTPEENRKYNETELNKALARSVANAAGKKRNDKHDKMFMEAYGERDPETAVNDFFLDVKNVLGDMGYSAIRDYKDAGGMAKVYTPTIIFDDNVLTRKIDDLWD